MLSSNLSKHVSSIIFAIDANRHFTILVTGTSGVGKSSLINALVGKLVAKEGRGMTVCTTETTKYSCEVIEGIELRAWDTPGFENDDSKDKSCLQDMITKLKDDVDLVVFCLRTDDSRFCRGDKEAMKKLTEAFGDELWEHTVIALTFANKVHHPHEGDENAYFMEELKFWREAIHSFLKDELKFGPEILQSLRILPTGYCASKDRKLSNCVDWLTNFWMACYTAPKSKGAINLLKMNNSRLEDGNQTSFSEHGSASFGAKVMRCLLG
ncbi:uncharacterized protein LOC111319148 [Stylophora pistillata]|uniref:uncharacterized protein LOC111319148 n=1 Tax=Stylophora pistillata TaxID=50429 RepID=UPI000C04D600|nr:uncharacterized protein LOC111319148 [Stylophora pistillata]